MSYLDQVQRGVDYIEAHLEQSLLLTDVSRAAAMSHWHFQRMFRALTGETLMTYVRSRRLSRAATRLVEGRDPIVQIAFDAGFEAQESFTRAFRRAYGLPPGEFRRLGHRRLFPEKVSIDATYLSHLERNVDREPRLEDWPERPVIGMRTRFYGVDSDKNNLGTRIPALWDAFLPRLARLPGTRTKAFGLIRSNPDDEALTYLACTTAIDAAPRDLEEDVVPAGTWAVFTHRGPASGLDHTVNYVYSTWLTGSRQWRHAYEPDVEIYGPEWHATASTSVMYYAIPVVRAD